MELRDSQCGRVPCVHSVNNAVRSTHRGFRIVTQSFRLYSQPVEAFMMDNTGGNAAERLMSRRISCSAAVYSVLAFVDFVVIQP